MLFQKLKHFFIIFFVGLFVLCNQKVWCGRLNFFLNILDPIDSEVFIYIEKIILVSNHHNIEILVNKRVSSYSDFAQYFLVTKEVPPTKYKQVYIKTSRSELKFSIDLSVQSKDSICLFLFWHVKDSIKYKKDFIDLRQQKKPIGEDTIYISCEDIDTIFALRTDLNQIQASIGIEGFPQDLVLNSQEKLYVLSAKKRSLYIIDIGSFQVIDRILLPLLTSPRYFILLPNQKIIVTDPYSQYVIKLDLSSGELLASKRLGHRPLELFYASQERLIFISSPLDQTVFVLTPDLSLRKRFSVQSPRGLLAVKSYLYVAEYDPGMVGVFDLSSGQNLYRIKTGRGSLHIHQVGRRLFITNEKEGSLAILRLGQRSISKKIFLGGQPFTLTSCARRRWLYVTDRQRRALMVIDLTAEKKVGEVKLGGIPFGISSSTQSQEGAREWLLNKPFFVPSGF